MESYQSLGSCLTFVDNYGKIWTKQYNIQLCTSWLHRDYLLINLITLLPSISVQLLIYELLLLFGINEEPNMHDMGIHKWILPGG